MSVMDVGLLRKSEQIAFASGTWMDYTSEYEYKASDSTTNAGACLVWRSLYESSYYTGFQISLRWQYISSTQAAWDNWIAEWTPFITIQLSALSVSNFIEKIGYYYSVPFSDILTTGAITDAALINALSGLYSDRGKDAIRLAIQIRGVFTNSGVDPITNEFLTISYSPTYTLSRVYFATENNLAIEYTCPGWSRADDSYSVTRFKNYLGNTRVTGTVQVKSSGGGGTVLVPVSLLPETPKPGDSISATVRFNCSWNASSRFFANDTTTTLTVQGQVCNTPVVSAEMTSDGFLKVNVSDANDHSRPVDNYCIKMLASGLSLDEDIQYVTGRTGYVEFKYPPLGIQIKIEAIGYYTNTSGTLYSNSVLYAYDAEKVPYNVLSPLNDSSIKCYAMYNAELEYTATPSTVTETFAFRTRPSVFYGDSSECTFDLSFQIPAEDIGDGMPSAMSQISKWMSIPSQGVCVFCSHDGERYKVAVTDMSHSKNYENQYYEMSVTMSEVD